MGASIEYRASQQRIYFTADHGEANNLTLTLDQGAGRYSFTDTGTAVREAGCRSPTTTGCPVPARLRR